MNILKLVDVYKAYDQHVAVNRVSFDIPSGSIFGLLGPNGAGKTSLIRIITTITQADAGSVFMNGEPLSSRHPSQIGYMPEERGLYKKMKVGDHLMYLAQLKGLSRKKARQAIGYWFEKFDIKSWWPKKVEELSKGMQQKIQFISTVIHEPKLLILDEPFSGLDPINTNLIKDEIDALNKKGTSIIFSTHRMEQVEEVCEKIVLINQGKNVLEGGVTEIKNQFKKNLFEVCFQGTLPSDIQERVEIVSRKDQSLTIKLAKTEDSKAFLQYLIQQDLYITAYNEVLPTINEIFIQQVAAKQAV
ncbi:MAG: ATP-binding cassette domain-containing protein [Bacteroidota bacterium]